MDRNFLNVLILGLSFMLLFTSFQTGGMIQGTVVQSLKEIHKGEYNADPFISMCIIYAVFALANWGAPAFVKYIGPRISMVISGLTYVIFIANFLVPLTWLLYVVSAIVGVGAAVIWTAQGNYLTLCSTDATMSRNSGLFWAMLQCSLLWGNIFVFFYFKTDKDGNVEEGVIRVTYIVLTILGLVGLAAFFLLGAPVSKSERSNGIEVGESKEKNGGGGAIKGREAEEEENLGFVEYITSSLKNSFKLLFTRQMSLLCVTFAYTGIELAFFSAVYGTCIGNTNQLSDESPKKFIGLSGLLIGAGEITGGLAFGILGSKTNKFGRNPIVILGFVLHIVAFILVFLNFPKDSPVQATSEDAYIASSMAMALVTSFLLGLADACYNTQIYSIVGVLYSEDSAPAFALFKFFQSIACAIAMFYASVANLYVQVIILLVGAVIGTGTFVMVEWKVRRD